MSRTIPTRTRIEMSSNGLDRRSLLQFSGTTLAAALLGLLDQSRARAADDKPLKVGFCIDGIDIPFYVPMIPTLQQTAKAQGFDLLLRSANWDPSLQVQQVGELLIQKVDVLCIKAVDVKAILPATKRAQAQGVPVVACGGKIEGFPYIGADDIEYGQKMGHMILDALASQNISGPKYVGFLRGSPGGGVDRDRYTGIMDVLKADPSVKVVAEASTDWQLDKGLSSAQNMLQRFGKGEIHVIHGWGGGVEVPGAKYAHTQANRSDVLFTGGELTKGTEEAIKAGWEYGVIIQDPSELARREMMAIREMAPKFETVPASAQIPLPQCTKANLSDFKSF